MSAMVDHGGTSHFPPIKENGHVHGNGHYHKHQHVNQRPPPRAGSPRPAGDPVKNSDDKKKSIDVQLVDLDREQTLSSRRASAKTTENRGGMKRNSLISLRQRCSTAPIYRTSMMRSQDAKGYRANTAAGTRRVST